MASTNAPLQRHESAKLTQLSAVAAAQHNIDWQQSIGVKIMLGGFANTLATTVTNPIDVVKVRLQLQALEPATGAAGGQTRYLGFGHGLKTIWKEEGFAGWAKGWQASLLREYIYSGIRFGAYDVVKETFEDKMFHISADERATSPLHIKLLAGATSGGIGSALVNPMDLVKVRMQADRTGARYHNSFIFACRQIYQQEGLVEGFYRGVAATTYRAMALTAAQLPSYDHTAVADVAGGRRDGPHDLEHVCRSDGGHGVIADGRDEDPDPERSQERRLQRPWPRVHVRSPYGRRPRFLQGMAAELVPPWPAHHHLAHGLRKPARLDGHGTRLIDVQRSGRPSC